MLGPVARRRRPEGLCRVHEEGAQVRRRHLGDHRQRQRRRLRVRASRRADLPGVVQYRKARRHGGVLRRHHRLQPHHGCPFRVDAPEAHPGQSLRQPPAGKPGQPAGDRAAHRSLHERSLRMGRHSQGPYQDVEEPAQARKHGGAGLGQAARPAHAGRRAGRLMVLDNLLGLAAEAEGDAEAYEVAAREAVRALVAPKGKVEPKLLEREQFAAHGFAWIATYVAALRQMRRWAEFGGQSGNGSELELLMLQSAFGEYLAQLSGGIAISQVEIVRPADLGVDAAALDTPAVKKLIAGNTAAVRLRIAELITDVLDSGNFGALELGDEALEEVRRQFRRFVEAGVAPHAHGWHLRAALSPLPVVGKVAGLGGFGLTVPEEWGGLGMGKLAMCVVTEELSRGYIGVGSLGTRSEIAAELIRSGGTEAQKKKYLSRIASGELLPTAVFTEPNTGSDLASLRTRAVLEGGTYQINGNQTSITHAARAHALT